jgi:hypothetical protein
MHERNLNFTDDDASNRHSVGVILLNLR